MRAFCLVLARLGEPAPGNSPGSLGRNKKGSTMGLSLSFKGTVIILGRLA